MCDFSLHLSILGHRTKKKLTKGENVTPCKGMSTQGCSVFMTEIPSTGLCVKGSVLSVVLLGTVDTFKRSPYVVESSWV